MHEIKKSRFSPEAPNPLKHKHLGTFLEPETHKCAFFTFGLTFPSWSVFGAKSAPEVENGQNSAFCTQKWKNRVFAILVKKKCPERYVYKGFCASARKDGNHIFHFFHIFSNSMPRAGKYSGCFFFTEEQLFNEKTLLSEMDVFLRKINHFGSNNRPRSFFAIFTLKTEKGNPTLCWGFEEFPEITLDR